MRTLVDKFLKGFWEDQSKVQNKKHHAKKDRGLCTKTGRKRSAIIGFTRFTFARPGTQEYKRFLVQPQHPTHIKEIHKYLDLRFKLGTEHKFVPVAIL